MKCKFNIINIFILYIIIPIQTVISLVELNYPSAISLSNGNIFVVEKKGIFIYDEQLKNIIHSYIFEESEQINNVTSLSNIRIKQSNDYIICLINLKIYFFDSEGQLILNDTDKIINDEDFYQLTLVTIPMNDNNYFYYLIGYYSYLYSSYYEEDLFALKLIYYKINLINKNNTYICDLQYEKFISFFLNFKYYLLNKDLSCDYMQDESGENDNLLVCFFIIKKDGKPSLSHHFFKVTTSKITKYNYYYYEYDNSLNDVILLQSVPNIDRDNELICLLFVDESLNCYKFKYADFLIPTGTFYQTLNTNFNCRNE